jgi:hypothetical protein
MSNQKPGEKPKYEKPNVVSLGMLAQGADYCATGSNAGPGYCTAGNTAASACTAGGQAIGAACTAGGNPGVKVSGHFISGSKKNK